MKLLILSSFAYSAVSFLTSSRHAHTSFGGSTFYNKNVCRERSQSKVKLYYQNHRDVTYPNNDLMVVEKKSRKQSASRIELLLATGRSLVIQLRNRANQIKKNTVSDIERKTYTQKLSDGLLHLKSALRIARDADLKMGLYCNQESLEAWNEIDRIYNELETRPVGVNAIVVACNALEMAFANFQQ